MRTRNGNSTRLMIVVAPTITISLFARSLRCWRSKVSWQIWCRSICRFSVNWWRKWAILLRRCVVFLQVRNTLPRLRSEEVDRRVTRRSKWNILAKETPHRWSTLSNSWPRFCGQYLLVLIIIVKSAYFCRELKLQPNCLQSYRSLCSSGEYSVDAVAWKLIFLRKMTDETALKMLDITFPVPNQRVRCCEW